VYWRWIGYLPRANRTAKPLSSHVSFGCAKYFVEIDLDEKLFKCGMQVERGYLRAPKDFPHCQLNSDWDWHRFYRGLGARGQIAAELKRLVVDEGFRIHAGDWDRRDFHFSKSNPPGAAQIRKAMSAAAPDHWAGIQIYYPMNQREVESSTGLDLIESMLAIFAELTPIMNLSMQIQLEPRTPLQRGVPDFSSLGV
jgi:hypothetical protein